MEADADRDQRGDSAPYTNDPFRRSGHARQQPQHGRLPGAVATDNPNRFPWLDLHVNVPKSPQVTAALASGESPRPSDEQRNVVVFHVAFSSVRQTDS